MTDVLDLARRRREELIAEVSTLDEFIRTAEKLMLWSRSGKVRSAIASLNPAANPNVSVAMPSDEDTRELARRLVRRFATG